MGRLTKQFVDKGADYVMALKGNQGQLNDDVQALFHNAWWENYQDIPHSTYKHTNAGHGRVEVRKCTQLEMK